MSYFFRVIGKNRPEKLCRRKDRSRGGGILGQKSNEIFERKNGANQKE